MPSLNWTRHLLMKSPVGQKSRSSSMCISVAEFQLRWHIKSNMRHYSIKKKEGKNAHSTISGKHSIFNFLVIANAGKTINVTKGERERGKK